jgi:hypothetical protein
MGVSCLEDSGPYDYSPARGVSVRNQFSITSIGKEGNLALEMEWRLKLS